MVRQCRCWRTGRNGLQVDSVLRPKRAARAGDTTPALRVTAILLLCCHKPCAAASTSLVDREQVHFTCFVLPQLTLLALLSAPPPHCAPPNSAAAPSAALPTTTPTTAAPARWLPTATASSSPRHCKPCAAGRRHNDECTPPLACTRRHGCQAKRRCVRDGPPLVWFHAARQLPATPTRHTEPRRHIHIQIPLK